MWQSDWIWYVCSKLSISNTQCVQFGGVFLFSLPVDMQKQSMWADMFSCSHLHGSCRAAAAAVCLSTCGFPLRLSAQLLFLGLIVQLICRHVLKMLPLSFLLCSIFFSLSCRQGQNRIAVEENTTLLRLIASVIFITNAEMRMFVTNLLGQKLSCKKSLNGTTPVSLAIYPIIYVLDHIC